MDYEAWAEKYKPIKNPNADHGYDGTMFETFGADIEAVRAADPATVWTLTDEDNVSAITPGIRFVNRMGYFITEVPAGDDAPDEIVVDDGSDFADDEDENEDA